MRRTSLVAAAVATVVVLALAVAPAAQVVTAGPAAAATGDVVVAAAGDIACAPGAARTSTKCHQGDTAAQLSAGGYDAVLALGDEQYPCGTFGNFNASYDPSWGQVKAKTFPIPGDNDYISNDGACTSPGAVGYFQYFNDRFTVMPSSPSQVCPNGGCPAYYSTDIGSWHVVALNSECTQTGVGGCSATSAQYKWLVADLAAHPSACTLAIMHKPYWGNGTLRRKTKSLVQALYRAHAELLLSGHDHLYVRFAPQNLSSAATSDGIRQFVVGTGGANHAALKADLPNTQVKDNTHFGVLRLTLHATSYDWAFIADNGSTVVDSGSGVCQ
jgi:acid phosphatase type 7